MGDLQQYHRGTMKTQQWLTSVPDSWHFKKIKFSGISLKKKKHLLEKKLFLVPKFESLNFMNDSCRDCCARFQQSIDTKY